ncbi:anti-sigma factor family protein [Chloroflexota bacterium]
MSCSDYEELLSNYANDEVSRTQREFVDEHLSDCADCRKALVGYSSVRQHLGALTDIQQKPDLKSAVMAQINGRKTKGTARKWLQPALASIPVLAIMITLSIIQPWNTANDSKGLLADIISASENIQSYRKSVSRQGGEEFWEFVLPDRLHGIINRINTTVTSGGVTTEIWGRTEYYIIGDKIYYLSDNAIDMSKDINRNGRQYVWGIPTIEYILGKLHFDWELKQLPDENIDGTDYLHYEAISRRTGSQTEFLIYQDGYLVREKIQRYESHGTIENNSIKYYDFNTNISIKPPLTATGELLPGWEMMDIESRTPWVSVDDAIKAISGSEDWSDPDILMEAFEMIYKVEDPKAYIDALPPGAQDALYDFHISLHERNTVIIESTYGYNEGVLHYTNSGTELDVVIDTGYINRDKSVETTDTTAIVNLWISAIQASDPQAYFDALPEETRMDMASSLYDESMLKLVIDALH